MDRNQAAKLLGIHHSATVAEANQALILKMDQLDERISTAPNQALTQKYRQMRQELIHAVQAFSAETHVHRSTSQAHQLVDLPTSTPSVTEGAPNSSFTAEPLFDDVGESAPVTASLSASRKPWGLAIGLVGIMIVVIVVGHKPLFQLWDRIRPPSQEELAAQKAELARLLAEIGVIKRRLENARRNLKQSLSDVERANSSDVAELTQWVQLTEMSIFNGTLILELEGKHSMGQSLQQERAYEQAKKQFAEVKAGYLTLIDEFQAAGQLYTAELRAEQSKQAWLAHQKKYGVDDPPAVTEAKATTQASENAQQQGDFVVALAKWQSLPEVWQEAYEQTADEVGAIVAKRKQLAEERLARERTIREKAARKEAEKKRRMLAELEWVTGSWYGRMDFTGSGCRFYYLQIWSGNSGYMKTEQRQSDCYRDPTAFFKPGKFGGKKNDSLMIYDVFVEVIKEGHYKITQIWDCDAMKADSDWCNPDNPNYEVDYNFYRLNSDEMTLRSSYPNRFVRGK